MAEPNASPETPEKPPEAEQSSHWSLRRAFITGLAALLPTAVSIAILVWVYQVIATPINKMIIEIMKLAGMSDAEDFFYHQNGQGFVNLSFSGFIVALAVIFFVGFLLQTFVGRRLYRFFDRLLSRLPILKLIYPHLKQLTEFIFSEDKKKASFRRVVMVEYPRKGIWSLGFVTGPSMAALREATGLDLITVFVPSSPTPFTGYVISLARSEIIDIPITADEALRFAVSGGVLVPPSQTVHIPQARPVGWRPDLPPVPGVGDH